MNDSNCYEPARSFDLGTYIWAIGTSLIGPELKAIKGFVHHLNDDTMRFGVEHIERTYEAEIQAMEDGAAQQFESFNPQA